MCTIVGWVGKPSLSLVEQLIDSVPLRGRDKYGLAFFDRNFQVIDTQCFDNSQFKEFKTYILEHGYNHKIFGAFLFGRAIPATEISTKSNKCQPVYDRENNVLLTHNGIVHNDTDSDHVDSYAIIQQFNQSKSEIDFIDKVTSNLVGTYAFTLLNKNNIILFRSFLPVWYKKTDKYVAWVSLPDKVEDFKFQELKPNAGLVIDKGLNVSTQISVRKSWSHTRSVLVVYSGGLDSLVTARLYQVLDYNVHLVYFNYGQKANQVEEYISKQFAKEYNLPLHIIDVTQSFQNFQSVLLTSKRTDGSLTEAETTSNYVPARNLILTSYALGLADQLKIGKVALGLNIDDGSVYPDNGIDFIRKLEQVTPLALDWFHQIEVRAPLTNLTKRELIQLGLEIGAPFELSVSCYYPKLVNGKIEVCHNCGSCYMRELSFKAVGLKDPLIDNTLLKHNTLYQNRRRLEYKTSLYALPSSEIIRYTI